MDERLSELFEQCVARIESGELLEACLANHATERAELEPALRAALQLRALPHPALVPGALIALEARMLDLAAQRRSNSPPARTTQPGQPEFWPRLVSGALLTELVRRAGFRLPLNPSILRMAMLALVVLVALAAAGTALAFVRFVAPPLVPTAQPTATAVPTLAATFAPTVVPANVVPTPEGNAKDNQCNGHQLGRDNPTCAPRPPPPGKGNGKGGKK